MGRPLDLTGKVFGRLTAERLDPVKSHQKGRRHWVCSCSCGKCVSVAVHELSSGHTKSCGCFAAGVTSARNTAAAKTRIGAGSVFGRLTVITEAPVRRGGTRGFYWGCRCTCGVEKLVLACHLRSGKVVSCGCWKAELARARVGSDNQAWKPELSDADREKRRNYPAVFARAALEEHGEFCVCCGAEYEEFHHLDAWRVAPLKRFCVTNVVPVCYECHRDFHDRYGKGRNTLEEFLNYLQEET